MHIKNIQPEDMLHSLRNGAIDAVAVWEVPALDILHKLNGRVIVIPNPPGIYKQTFNAISEKNYIEKNKEVIRRVIKSVVRSIDFMRENEKEAQSILTSLFPEKEEIIPDVWDNFVFEVSLDQSFISTLEDAAQWAMKNRLVGEATVPNFLDYIYFDALRAVKPEAISILH
jgi:NitT/TauT family transport system substrate-binding protein